MRGNDVDTPGIGTESNAIRGAEWTGEADAKAVEHVQCREHDLAILSRVIVVREAVAAGPEALAKLGQGLTVALLDRHDLGALRSLELAKEQRDAVRQVAPVGVRGTRGAVQEVLVDDPNGCGRGRRRRSVGTVAAARHRHRRDCNHRRRTPHGAHRTSRSGDW